MARIDASALDVPWSLIGTIIGVSSPGHRARAGAPASARRVAAREARMNGSRAKGRLVIRRDPLRYPPTCRPSGHAAPSPRAMPPISILISTSNPMAQVADGQHKQYHSPRAGNPSKQAALVEAVVPCSNSAKSMLGSCRSKMHCHCRMMRICFGCLHRSTAFRRAPDRRHRKIGRAS
jgi:hypothetical protein